MTAKQENSSDRKSPTVSGQSSAPQRWMPVWMSLVGLVVGVWFTCASGGVVFHRFQVWWRGGAFVWDGEARDRCFDCVVGLGLIFFVLRKEGEFRMARVLRPYGERRRWAHEAADRVIGTMQIDATPVDPQDVAQRLGLHLVAARDLPQAAVWCHHPAQPVLMVDESAIRSRLRFGMAHAIGHYLRESECADDGAEEFCCNEFAGALLMPQQWFRADMREDDNDDLAFMYDVSVPAVKARKKTLTDADPKNLEELFMSSNYGISLNEATLTLSTKMV